MPLKRVTIGKMLLEGDTDKELFQKYVLATLSSMADLDRVLLVTDRHKRAGDDRRNGASFR